MKAASPGKGKKVKDRFDGRNLESPVICRRSDPEIDYGLC